MKHALLSYSVLILILLLFYGCVSLDRSIRSIERAEGNDESVVIRPRKDQEFSEIHSDYDLESLLLPVLQYNNLILSFDFFPQFAWSGDVIFPRYLVRSFQLENSPFRPGEGAVLHAGYEGLKTELRIERALLSRGHDGDWWKINHTYFDETVYCEVLISGSESPVRIRYLDLETGTPHEIISPITREGGIAEDSATEGDASQNGEPVVEGLRAQEYAREWSNAFNHPVIVGEELIDVGAGRFMTVHMKDAYEDEYGSGADYWTSPDVPGNIVRIVYSSPGQESYVIELKELTAGNTSMIDPSQIVEGSHTGGDSEGSPSEPQRVTPGKSHDGWVAPGGTSYYRAAVQRRADIYVSVDVLDGEAELYFYGPDSTFYSWRTSSKGGELFAEEYFVQPDIDLYFTVVNPSNSEGRNLKISISQDVFLSPIGVAMRGEIYYRAQELRPDRTYKETVNIDGLNYYMTRVRRGRHLRITAFDLPSSVALIWFEASEGSYSGVYSVHEKDMSSIEITNVSPGTECYFYIVADTLKTSPGSTFSLEIEEYTR